MRHQDALAAVQVNSAAGVLGKGLFDPNFSRPFIGRDGHPYIVANGQRLRTNAPAMLQYDEWRDIDRRVIGVFTERIQAVADLMSAGLTHPLGNIGLTISLWDKVSDMTGADVSMSGVTEGEEDTPAYETDQVPVPIVHKDFRVNLRRLEGSRRMGEAIDVTAGALAARVVAEKNEDLLLSGSPIKVEGGVIYGYTNHPDRNTVDMTEQWTAAGKTGAEIVADVQAMLAAARADNRHGPFVLYIPGEYEGKLDDDYNPATSDTRTIRQRLLQLEGISRIAVLDRLANHNVLLVQLDRDVVDWAMAQDVTTVQWEVQGGMQQRFKVMTIGAPRVKADFDGRSGIVHLYEIP